MTIFRSDRACRLLCVNPRKLRLCGEMTEILPGLGSPGNQGYSFAKALRAAATVLSISSSL